MRDENIIEKKSGFTLIEIIVVLAIIGILSSLIAMYTVNSAKLGTNIKKEYNEVSEARIAMSYVVNLLQQNDISNSIVVDNTVTGAPILKVKRDGDASKEVKIFYDSSTNLLIESYTNGSSTYENQIAVIQGFNVEYNKATSAETLNEIVVTIQYKNISDDTVETLQQNVTLRSVNYSMGGKIL